MKGFAVLYRTVDPEYEHDFRGRWREATLRLRKEHGALGSCLTRDADGHFVAFARWPSEAARAEAFAAAPPSEPWPGILAFAETKLWIEEDHLSDLNPSAR